MSEFEKPTRQEDEYFAREDVEKLHRLSREQATSLETKEQSALKALHHMKCPKCGLDLHTLRRGSVDVDVCVHCKGVWLDAGELEAVMREQKAGKHSVVNAVLNIFRAGHSRGEEA